MTAALSLLALTALTVGAAVAEDEPLRWALQAGAGVYVPFEDGHSDVFGNSPILEFAASVNLPGTQTWVDLEVDRWRSGGHEWQYDPAFRTWETSYWALPVGLVVRANAVPAGNRSPVAVYLGFGLTTLFTRFSLPDGSHSSPTGFGGHLEMRPEIRLSDSLRLYARERLGLFTEIRHDPSLAALGYEGSFLTLGLSRRFQ